MTATGARLDRRAPPVTVRGDVRSGRESGLRAPAPLAFALATLGSLGCTNLGPPPSISHLTPAIAYSDVTVALLVDAPMLHQALVVDLSGETATYEPASVQMSLVGEEPELPGSVPLGAVQDVGADESTYLTSIPPGVPAGMYGLRVVPPDGHPVILHAAFQELGPDLTPPTVIVDMPTAGTTVGVGTVVTGMIRVDDGLGGLSSVTWTTTDGSMGNCPLTLQPVTNAPPAQVECPPFQFQVADFPDDAGPTVPDTLTVVAVDVSLQMKSLDVPLIAAHVPVVDSFENSYGSLGGHQPFAVHGRYFPQGAQVYIGGVAIIGNPPDDLPGGDVSADGTTIVGLTPPDSRPMQVAVEVRAPAGMGRANNTFSYISPPRIRSIQPATSPTAGGTFVTVAGNDLLYGVQIGFGDSPDVAQLLTGNTYTADDKVTGYVPPGQGLVSVWAIDPITGTGVPLAGGFTYSDEVADAGVTPAPDDITAAKK